MKSEWSPDAVERYKSNLLTGSGSESAVYLPDDEGLADMAQMGWASWNMTFDLLIWLHASAKVLFDALSYNANPDAELQTGMNALNLTKFQRWDAV